MPDDKEHSGSDPYGLWPSLNPLAEMPMPSAHAAGPDDLEAEARLLRQFASQESNQDNWPELRLYWEKLNQNLRSLNIDGGIALAFSGGLDSMVLLQLCLEIKLEVLALHFAGPQFASSHSRAAIAWLEEHQVPYKVVSYHALAIPEVRRSDPKRCYYCKKHVMGLLRQEAGGRILCDGTNSTDFKGYRPGLDALREEGVYSPFASVMLGKPQIRQIARILNLDAPSYNGQNCLLTRFEYGLPVFEEQLAAIEQAEEKIRPLLSKYGPDGELEGTLQYRLRYLADPGAKQGARAELHIESSMRLPAGLERKLAGVLAAHGLDGAPIVAMPKVSGFFDKKQPTLDE